MSATEFGHCPDSPDPVERLSIASTIGIGIGILMIVSGIFVPTDYTMNPQLPAREMESIEIYYHRLSFALEVCIVVGMALVTAGTVVQTGIIVRMCLMGELDPRSQAASRTGSLFSGTEMTALQADSSYDPARNYGTSQRQQSSSSRTGESSTVTEEEH